MNHSAIQLLPAALIHMDRLQEMQAEAFQAKDLRARVEELQDQKAVLEGEKDRLMKNEASLKDNLDDTKQRILALQTVTGDHRKRGELLESKVKRVRETQTASRFVDSIVSLVSGLYTCRDYTV